MYLAAKLPVSRLPPLIELPNLLVFILFDQREHVTVLFLRWGSEEELPGIGKEKALTLGYL